jgi:ubiquinone/menaquinone biosynthesis C-methylase UbiE
MSKECNDSCENNCGLFDFMANSIGIKVLHPGGYQATDKLCSMLNLSDDSKVLDLACGVGTTSLRIHKNFKCDVTGIDISETLIETANRNLLNTKLNDKVRFKVADALELPFPDNSFDSVIAQAFFILIDEKEKAIDEIFRVLKPNGYFGSLELSWFKKPSEEAFNELKAKTCNDFIPRVSLFEEWEKLFTSVGFDHIRTIKNPMVGGMLKMVKTEGILNFIRIMQKLMNNSVDRKRMMDVQKTFDKYNDYLGYGLFSFKK